MKRQEISKRVIDICIDKLGLEKDEITEMSEFHTDLGTDSLDDIELLMEFEKEFNISIEDEKAEKVTTVKEAIDSIYNLINK